MIGPSIKQVETTQDLQAVADLFRAYAASLDIDLAYQDFASELAGLPGKYALPRGALLLARDEAGAALGCVGLRPLGEERVGEIKRLYILPSARGLGLGWALAEAAVEEASRLGYSELRLDTLPSMSAAISMYRRMGFEPIEPYYGPTPPGTLFMALSL
ncbi:MAG: GNAT family N-acetyltransferase [Sphingomonas sp.]|nr:GNAT family N-acetyltransferase [Sphingomonas sp.]